MKQSISHYYLMLDVSYSMEMIWDIIKSQINLHLENIEDLQIKHPELLVKYRLITFNQETHIYPVEDGAEDISTILEKLVPDGQSALFDALGFGLKIIEKDLDVCQTNTDSPTLILVLLTDGGDNASKQFQLNTISAYLTAIKNSGFSDTHFNLIGINPGFKDVFNILHIDGFQHAKFDHEELKLSFQYIEALLQSLCQSK